MSPLRRALLYGLSSILLLAGCSFDGLYMHNCLTGANYSSNWEYYHLVLDHNDLRTCPVTFTRPGDLISRAESSSTHTRMTSWI